MDEKITVGGREFLIPPLSAGRIIDFSCIVVGLGTLSTARMDKVQMRSVYEALLIGIQQNKPDLTIEQLLDMPIPMNRAIDALKIIAKQAGLDFETNPQQPAETEAGASLTPPASSVNGTGLSQR
jgi:hypothetical protein